MLKAKQAWCLWRLDYYQLSCALVTKVFVKQILMVDHNLEYKGHSISNQPALFPIKIDHFFKKISISIKILFNPMFEKYII